MASMAYRGPKKVRDAVKGVYRGYIPEGLPQHRKPNRIKPWWKVVGKPRLTMYPKPEVEEYSEEPEYPAIYDASSAGRKRKVRLDWYEHLKSIPTAEQKLYEIDRHSQHKMAHINNWLPTCNSLPFVQYLTQTHVINSLPASYELPSSDASRTPLAQVDGGHAVESETQLNVNNRIKQIVLEQIVLDKFESEKNRKPPLIPHSIRDGNARPYLSNTLIQNIFNNVKKALVYETNPQLMDYHVDLSPSIRSWWYHSGFQPNDNKVFHRSRKDKDGNVNTIFQMDGSSAANMRSKHLMEPILAMDDPLVTDISLVKKDDFNPKHHNVIYKFKWPVALPGYWVQDNSQHDCPHTSFLSTDCLKIRQKKYFNFANQFEDTEDCLNSQAILTAFGWLNSLSMYHGYTPFQEIDYPLTCQVVTTNGQDWLFNVYQFNSHAFHRDLGGPKRNNVCWSSGLMKLYDVYETGSFKGVNDVVVKILTNFMSKQVSPQYTEQLNMRPYLGEDTRSQEEIDEMRNGLRRMFEGRQDRYMSTLWNVPEYEHIFFRSKVARHQIRHMKPKWKPPKPVYPKIFE